MAAFVTWVTLIFLTQLVVSSEASRRCNVPAVFAFGDSSFDTGNNNKLITYVKANFPPYGEAFPDKKATGWFSNGRIVPNFIASALNLSDLLPPSLGHIVMINDIGVSFASRGTGLDDLTATKANVQPISRQLDNFKLYIGTMTALKGEADAKKFIRKSLFLVSIGCNDMVMNYYIFRDRSATFTIPQYHSFLLDRLKFLLQSMYELGARNFIVSGMQPVGCFPLQITLESIKKFIIPRPTNCIQEQNDVAVGYNTKLQKMLQQLLVEFNCKEKTRLAYYDAYGSLFDMFSNPQKYGFTETKRGCCGTGLLEVGPFCNALNLLCPNRSQYMFFDSIHGSQATNKAIAVEVMKLVSAMFES